MSTFRKYHKEFLAGLITLSVLLSLIYISPPPKVLGATYTFTQNSWSGGATSNTASHPTNETGWTQYSSSTNMGTPSTSLGLAVTNPWWNASWANRIKITFSGATTTENEANFPVLVQLNSSRINYSQTKAGGADIRFVGPDNSTSLNYQIEKWDTTATSSIWVEAQHVSSTQTDFIYMYYNNPSAIDNQNSTGVWDSNYAGVWHLKELLGGVGPGIAYDSTINGNNGTGINSPTQTPGQIDGSLTMNCTLNSVYCKNSTALVSTTAQIQTMASGGNSSISWWMSPNFVPNDSNSYAFWGQRNPTGTPIFACEKYTDNNIYCGWNNGSTDSRVIIAANSSNLTQNLWQFYTLSVVNGGYTTLYRNGVQIGQNSVNTGATSSPGTFVLGGYDNGGGAYFGYPGGMDEFRISSTTRSVGWIWDDYKSESDTLNTYGAAETFTQLSGNIISSAYDSANATNSIGSLSWIEDATLPASTTVTVSLRTASTSAALAQNAWTDFTNATAGCTKSIGTVTCGSSALPAGMEGITNNEWFQYKVSLTSSGAYSPTVTQIQIQYVINVPPAFDPNYPTTGAGGASASQDTTSSDATFGKISVNYSVLDSDTNTDPTPGYISPSFQYNLGGGWVNVSTSTLNSSDYTNKAVATSSYSTYSATWNVASQLPNTYSTNAQVRVIANDLSPLNNLAYATSAVFTIDTTTPTSTANINAASGTVTYSLSDETNVSYRLSNNSNYGADGVNASSGSWIATNATTTSGSLNWTFNTVGGYPVLYWNDRDVYGNTVITTIVAPSQPTSMDIKDTSNVSINSYSNFISWAVYTATTSAAFGSYNVYRSTDGTNYSLLAVVNSSSTNYYRDTSLSSSTTYYYKVITQDTDGDTSQYSSAVSHEPTGSGGTDITPPAISAVTASPVQATWATITWTTDKLSNSEVDYGTTAGNLTSVASSNSFVTSHSITLTGLTPNTQYYFQVKSVDYNSNSATDNNGGADYSFTSTNGPTISNVTVQSVTGSTATIIWNTTTAANSYVDYSTHSDLSGSSETGSSTLVTSHSVALSGLSSKTTYYFYVKSTDGSSNTVTDTNGGNYYTFNTTYNTKPPAISNVSVPVATKNSAIVIWQTDTLSTSQVQYGTVSGLYANSTNVDNTLTTEHDVTLTGLTKTTTYYYIVASTDADGNQATSTEKSFTTSDLDQVIIISTSGGAAAAPPRNTTPPTISGIKITDITPFGATVTFDTSEPANSFVAYGLDTNYGYSAGSPDYTTSHSITIANLSPGNEYHLLIKSQDQNGNVGSSDDLTFDTIGIADISKVINLSNAAEFQSQLENVIQSALPSIVPPAIGSINVADVTENSATISWGANVSSYGSLAYAKDSDYQIASSSNPYTTEIKANDKKARDFSVALSNLTPSTNYHFQAKAFVIPGAVGKSEDQTFLTTASKIHADIVRLGNTDLDIRWTTDSETSSFVEYKNLSTGKIQRQGDDTKLKVHAITISGLTQDTPYEVRAFGYDDNNNIVQTDPVQIRTRKDITPPVISNIRVDNALIPGRADRLQTVISWQTDKPSNSIVNYEEGVGTAETLANQAGQATEYTTDHIVIVTNFKPSTIYRIQVVTEDESHNVAQSPIRTVLTPQQAQSVLDVITKNLQETFGFLGKLQR